MSVALHGSSNVSNPNSEDDEDDYSTIRNLSRNVPSDDALDVNENGDSSYSSRMEEIFSDDDSENGPEWSEDKIENEASEDPDEDEEEGFVYTGKDAEVPSGGYQEQLKDVLDGDEEDNEDSATGYGSDLLSPVPQGNAHLEDHEYVHVVDNSASELSASDSPIRVPHLEMDTPGAWNSHGPEIRPFLHPSISRLRSNLPSARQRVTSSSSVGTEHILGRNVLSPSPSRFSSISRTSSTSNLTAAYTSASRDDKGPEAFKWTILRVIGEHVYIKSPEKANALLGTPVIGSPTVLAANGLICIGTDAGRVFVFDFKQELKCICGNEDSAKSFGAVTAVALSHDHTFIAVGHIYGHIQLFDVKHPQVAARAVAPTSLASVRSGRQEGHLLGSRIVSMGFISGRHTAFVSSDDQGLSFYHSLGKVLFMDANDCLRLLGKYPEEELVPSLQSTKHKNPSNGLATPSASANGSSTPRGLQQGQRKANTILAMDPLPLGTIEHPTDAYQLVAMLTPIKLVIVGLKPSPKTWFRRHREGEDGESGKSRWRGCLAWYPSIITTEISTSGNRKSNKSQTSQQTGTSPLLAYSWGSTLFILHVYETRHSRTVQNEKTGRTEKVNIGRVNFENHGLLTIRSDILAIEWLNSNQIMLVTNASLEIFEIRASKIVESVPFDALSLVSPTLSYSSNGIIAYHDSVRDIQHSVRAYKGKVFFLGYREIKVGTLLSWADRILSYVQDGDFLSAINLARDYYLGQAKGNKNGLPEDLDALHSMVGEKMRDLMVASARYAFSEDRLTDSTHVTADNRGVDRTSLFEDLVTTCARACIALDDFDFLFEDLFQYYDDSGISGIYLRQLEPFILDSAIHFIPPRITQRLISMHDDANNQEAAERLIWHIDPDCLDISQTLTLCQKYQLYDALIYVYESALNDYITPIVELIGLVRKVQQLRKERALDATLTEVTGQKLVLNAYKIYPYLLNVLSGQRYPSEKPLPPEDAAKAQSDAYSFVFHGRSSVWPPGEDGRLVLTADEEGGVEPTYPYARLLLRFDAEAFLHVLDIAFEHSYLNDESNGISRQVIIKILIDIVATSALSQADITFVNIFIARNVPKYQYTQFIHVAPSYLHNLLIGLASDADQSTREDRQLAAEFLLSAYKPHDTEKILQLFEEAGFYRILRSWHRQERQWAPLLLTYVHDPDLPTDEVFQNVEETLSQANRANGNRLPEDVLLGLQDSISVLLQGSIPHTALLVDKYAPELHSRILSTFGESEAHKKYAYLRCLLGPPPSSDETHNYSREGGPSTSVNSELRKLYLKLLCELEPSNVIVGLEYLPKESLDTSEIARICEQANMPEAVVWLMNEESAVDSLSKLEQFSNDLTSKLGEELLRLDDSASVSAALEKQMGKLDALYRMGIEICREDSEQTAEADIPVEDLWFKLLRSQIDAVQAISSSIPPFSEKSVWSPAEEHVIKSLRGLVQESFTNLVAVSSTKAVSLPRLFKRLLASTERPQSHSGTKYAEFRNIITSMLDSYRSEADLLVMSKRIIDSDFFDVYEELAKARSRGWAASAPKCPNCRKFVNPGSLPSTEQSSQNSIIISRFGVYHSACFPSNELSA